jgi:hypothetical protein
MKKWLEIVAGAFRRFNEDDGWAIASHIALSILTSLFPFLIFVTAIASMFGTKELADEAAHILLESWPEKVATPLAREIHNVLTQTRGGLLTVGIVLAIYFSTSAVEALRVALTRAYELREQRAWWLLRLESALYVLVGALGLLALAFLVVLAPLIWRAVVRFAPAVESLRDVVTLYRFASSNERRPVCWALTSTPCCPARAGSSTSWCAPAESCPRGTLPTCTGRRGGRPRACWRRKPASDARNASPACASDASTHSARRRSG